jgi:hypothetical protein
MENYEVPPHIDLPYGYMEREIKFKLLAAHAMVDREFFEHLREDPDGAAAELHIRLSDNDLIYLRELVEWDRIDKVADEIRESLRLEMVTNSW